MRSLRKRRCNTQEGLAILQSVGTIHRASREKRCIHFRMAEW
ncbi:MAG: hypothetical protein WCG42_02655 [Parachlamydiaceae bacterium]